MIRKIIIVVLTLGAVGSVVVRMGRSFDAHVEWASYTNRDETSLPAHSIRILGATLSNDIIHVGFLRYPQWSMSGDDARQVRENVRPGINWWVEDQVKLPWRSGTFSWQWRPSIRTFGSRGFAFLTPLWYATLALAAYPAIAFIRGPFRRYRRRKRGLCVTCGYDLRGSPERKCSECGSERA